MRSDLEYEVDALRRKLTAMETDLARAVGIMRNLVHTLNERLDYQSAMLERLQALLTEAKDA